MNSPRVIINFNSDYVFIGLDPAYRGSAPALRRSESQTANSELDQRLVAVTNDGGQITE